MKNNLLFLFLMLLLGSCDSDDAITKKSEIDVSNFNELSGVNDIDLEKEYDVVIYGGTSGALIAAKEVINSKKTVIVISPTGSALGGMTTNGLGATDLLNPNILGGITKDFYKEIKKYYLNKGNCVYSDQQKYSPFFSNGDIMLSFEPKAAQSVFHNFIVENQIPIVHSQRLNLNKKVVKNADNSINYIEMESGLKIKGKMYIDASYEGDLMAKSGVEYTIGRESNASYNESYNGVQRMGATDKNQLPDGIKILSTNLEANLGPNGSSDKKLQAYCYRMCLTDVPENKVDFQKPSNYKEEDYSLLFEYLKYYKGNLLSNLSMPNGKTDSNNAGPVSTDFVGQNYNYADGSYADRERIIENSKRYQKGLMWTLAYHDKVPKEIRDVYSKWGLPKDEFINNEHWPNQLYIRESRRMISDYVMTEHNNLGRIKAQQPIGFADYIMDSHIVQRYVDRNGNLKNEGHIYAGTGKPYPIDFRAIIPKKIQCSNLFVTFCVSASHSSYGSIRMEPIFMNLNQVAAVAAVLAIDKKTSVQNLDYNDLKNELLKRGIIL